MPPQETGKQRAARIPLDYYTHADVLERWKLRLGAIALLLTVAWTGAYAAMNRQQLDFQASRGPVASVHQTWNAQCSACHVDFTPISSSSWSAPFLGDPHESSQRCQTCHKGPDHHASAKTDMNCASCHRDHRGADASLVNLPDTDCTQCHKDLHKHIDASKALHVKHGGKEFDNKVTRFTKDTHPLFRSLEKDPGKLKFNHQQHLTAGIPISDREGKKGGSLKNLGDLPDAYRSRYRQQQEKKSDSDPVQLQCASCHQLDAGDFGLAEQQAKEFPNTLAAKRGSGAYMQPIIYENQCQACHPLTVARNDPDDPKQGYLTVPHRWQPKQIHEYLANAITAQLARGQQGFLEKKVTRPLPGKMPEVLDPKLVDAINAKVARMENNLYNAKMVCAECHEIEGKNRIQVVIGDPVELRIAPTNVPTVWFQHAKFNHAAHRAVDCASCHDKAKTSEKNTDVLIPNRDNCVQCHAPSSKQGTPGARFNCTECHLYHNGDHSTQGIGAARRGPSSTQSVDDFLRVK